jgi:hypothetical protein
MPVKSARMFAAVAVLVLVLASAAPSVLAEGSTTGGFHLKGEAGTMNIEFNARATDNRGSGSGQMTFSAPVDLPDLLGDEESSDKRSTVTLFMKVDLDCVLVISNHAAMSGFVRSATINGFVGRRVVLAVEDGGEGSKSEADKFTWGVYDVHHLKWSPSDAELEFDDGWSRTWIATDAERQDDPGVQILRNSETDCRSFPLTAYNYIEIPQGGGNIQVRP